MVAEAVTGGSLYWFILIFSPFLPISSLLRSFFVCEATVEVFFVTNVKAMEFANKLFGTESQTNFREINLNGKRHK